MTLTRESLVEILEESAERVRKWPAWKRSPEVQAALASLDKQRETAAAMEKDPGKGRPHGRDERDMMATPFDVEGLRRGSNSICFVGVGYIGYSAAAYYQYRGVSCVGIDSAAPVREAVMQGRCPVPNLDAWLRVNGMRPEDIRFPVYSDLGAPDFQDWISRVTVYKLCVPTEHKGEVSHDLLVEVCQTVRKLIYDHARSPVLVDIESTVSPRVLVDRIFPIFEGSAHHALLSVSPRRDWFVSSERDLHRIPRVVGGMTPEAAEAARGVNALVCKEVLVASRAQEAAATKALENTIRNVCLRTVNDVARQCQDLDVLEMAHLVATKWNIGLYEPSLGLGGYCIPLGPEYLLGPGAKGSRGLEQTEAVIQAITASGLSPVALVGLAYRGDVPVFKSSPFLRIAQELSGRVSLVLSDPYGAEFVFRLGDEQVPGGGFPACVEGAELVIVGAGHSCYRRVSAGKLFPHLAKCKVVIDNEGVLSHISPAQWRERNIRYIRPGQPGWLVFGGSKS